MLDIPQCVRSEAHMEQSGAKKKKRVQRNKQN